MVIRATAESSFDANLSMYPAGEWCQPLSVAEPAYHVQYVYGATCCECAKSPEEKAQRLAEKLLFVEVGRGEKVSKARAAELLEIAREVHGLPAKG